MLDEGCGDDENGLVILAVAELPLLDLVLQVGLEDRIAQPPHQSEHMRLHLSVRVSMVGRQGLISAFKRVPERIELYLRYGGERSVLQFPEAAQVAHKPRVSSERSCSFGGSGEQKAQKSNA
jgi:hypothetical protein